MKKYPLFLLTSLALLFSNCGEDKFIDPNFVCETQDMGITEAARQVEEGFTGDSIAWEVALDGNIMTLSWSGLCGDECVQDEILEFDLSQEGCVGLRMHIVKSRDQFDGRETEDLGTQDFQLQHWVKDSLLVGRSSGVDFWVEF